MKILKYECQSRGGADWKFSPVEFQKLNLLVGDTATGKTKFLNTIFNLARFVGKNEYRSGFWNITFSLGEIQYRWTIETDDLVNSKDSRIIAEGLWEIKNGRERQLVDRSPDKFMFLKAKLPKLSPKITSISLLKEEEIIQPLYEGLSTMIRRRFFHDALIKASALEAVTPDIVDKIATTRDLYGSGMGLNSTLYVLSRRFPDLYKAVSENFMAAFPFVRGTEMQDLSKVAPHIKFPVEISVFCIRERNFDSWIPLTELSSGMQKILLILTDTMTIPDGGIYLIDEYENSLGISAIDFFPDFMLTLEKDIQFLISSHHPYIINEIPPRNWYLFHRIGTRVTIMHGEELEARFGKSKQKAFVQLINDSFYVEGVK